MNLETSTFEDIHFNFVKNLVNKSRENNVYKFVHLSALNADQNGPSRYLQSKGKADEYICAINDEVNSKLLFLDHQLFLVRKIVFLIDLTNCLNISLFFL